MQKRQAQSNSKSRSEKFNPHQEEVASGFPIEPPRISQAREDSGISRHGHHHKRASHSGPLVNPAAWVKAGKNMDDVSKVSNGAEISTLSGPMAARRSFLSEDKREKSSSLQSGAPKLVSRFPGSFKEVSSESMKRRDQMQGPANSHQNEDGRSSNKDPVLLGYGSKGSKIHYSGPLIVPSSNMDQMLKDHDRHIQEAVRRARIDKAKIRKMQAEGNQVSSASLFVAGR
ncbi:probable serine/threonine-protein kinase At1g09600 [Spinacia oleracea]|nr:probable serine/threonine-protein kinase At1g09600 [Spinacia oleracea]